MPNSERVLVSRILVWSMPGDHQTIEIVFPPAGEAPLWVREKWIGLRLPVASPEAKPVCALTAGVLTGPKGLLAALAHGRSLPPKAAARGRAMTRGGSA